MESFLLIGVVACLAMLCVVVGRLHLAEQRERAYWVQIRSAHLAAMRAIHALQVDREIRESWHEGK